MFRRTYVEINTDILKQNVITLRKAYSDYQYYIGVVKANVYGHGYQTIKSLIEGGVNYLAASSLEECLEIRKQDSEIPILCLEPIGIDYLGICLENKIAITVHDYMYYQKIMKLSLRKQLNVHIKIDSGMNRLGVKDKEEVTEMVTELSKKYILEGIYTHFATAGISDKHWDNQLASFMYLTSGIDLKKIPIVHLGRSLTLLRHEKIPFCTGVRMGIAMYGFDHKTKTGGLRGKIRQFKSNLLKKINKVSHTIESKVTLQTAFSLYSEIIQIKLIKKGDFVGYNASFVAKEDMKIAVVPIGYGDGLSATIKEVSIGNKRYPVVGDVCMDMIMVKVDEQVSMSDKVVLCGKELPIPVVTAKMGSNAYRFLTSINTRVPRIYKTSKEEK